MKQKTKEQAKLFVIECLDNFYNRSYNNKEYFEWYRDYHNNKRVKWEYHHHFRWFIITQEIKPFHKNQFGQDFPLSFATINKIFDNRFNEIMNEYRVNPDYYRSIKITITDDENYMGLKPTNKVGFTTKQEWLNAIKGKTLILPSGKEYKLDWFRRDGTIYVELSYNEKKLVIGYNDYKKEDTEQLLLKMTEEQIESQIELKELLQA